MNPEQKKILQWFLGFTALHVALFVVPPFFFESFNERVNWFAINAIPWWPLYKLGLPVTREGWLMMPNALGWAWCALVWTVFYFALARLVVKMWLRQSS